MDLSIVQPDSTDFDVGNIQLLQIAVNMMIYMLLDIIEILIATQFMINSCYISLIAHYITLDHYDSPIESEWYEILIKSDSTNI